MTFEDFIMEARALNASDIHLTVGQSALPQLYV